MSAARRAGLLVLIASFAGHAGNYLFYVVAARMVTPPEFAAISALVAFGTITWTPVNGVQLAITRNVAVLRTSGTPGEVSAYLRQQGRRMGLAALLVAGAIVALSPVLSDRLNIGSVQAVVLAGLWIGTTFLLLAMTGVAQGLERFGYVAFSLAGPLGVLRLLLLPLCLLAAGMTGSMWAMIIASVIGLAVLARPFASVVTAPPTEAPASTNTLSAMTGLLAFSSLTNVDLLVAQAMLQEADRGLYASAVLLGKVALFAPAALAMVLLPRASAALERGESADAAVLKTHVLTASASLLITGGLWVLPTWVISVTFGPQYAASKPLLPLLALVMTGAAVLWVHLTFSIARKSKRMVAGMVGVALLHWALLAVLHDTPHHVILASATAVGTALLGVEFGSRSGLVRLLLRSRRLPDRQAEPQRN